MGRTIYLVRHTSVDVVAGTCYGWTDVMPSASYDAELAEIKRQLSGINFARTYSSPLTRCAKLANDLSSQVTQDDRLRETNFGDWEGLSWEMIYRLPESGRWFNDFINERTPNGESFQDVRLRVEEFLESLPTTDDNTLIITHSGVIRVILVALNQIEVDQSFEIELPFGSIIKIEI